MYNKNKNELKEQNLQQNKSIERMVAAIAKVHSCYKDGLAMQGLGAVIVEREWQLDYNPFRGWHRAERPVYKTVEELESYKTVLIDVIGIDDYDPKGKSLLDLINEYGTTRVISAEMSYDPFWFQEPKSLNWRFWRVLVKPWEVPEKDEAVSVFKLLNNI